MRQIIDWEKIQNVAADDVNFVFHWKYDGSYDQGDFVKLMKYRDNKLAEVVGYMTDRPKTKDELLSIAKEEARQAEVLFTAYANIDFCNLTALINENYTDGFDDECFDVKCSDYIDITKHEYDIIDLQKIVKAFCDEALKRYMADYISWLTSDRDEEIAISPEGHFAHNGICIDIDKWGVNISFRPISVYASDDEVVGVVVE
jgi:hypothetical protein